MPALRGRTLPYGRPLFLSYLAQGARGVRHGARKYLRADHGHELFDLASDPGEFVNRAEDPACQAAVLDYVQKLLSWRMNHDEQSLTHIALTERELAFIVSHSRARFAVSQPESAGLIEATGIPSERIVRLAFQP